MLDQQQQQGQPQAPQGPQSPLLYSPTGGSGGGGAFQGFQRQARQITKNPQNMFQVRLLQLCLCNGYSCFLSFQSSTMNGFGGGGGGGGPSSGGYPNSGGRGMYDHPSPPNSSYGMGGSVARMDQQRRLSPSK